MLFSLLILLFSRKLSFSSSQSLPHSFSVSRILSELNSDNRPWFLGLYEQTYFPAALFMDMHVSQEAQPTTAISGPLSVPLLYIQCREKRRGRERHWVLTPWSLWIKPYLKSGTSLTLWLYDSINSPNGFSVTCNRKSSSICREKEMRKGIKWKGRERERRKEQWKIGPRS